jgi:WD40 repeat protein
MSASDDDETLRLWNVNDGIVQEELAGYSIPVTFSPDGMAQASRLPNGNVKLWGAVSKTLKRGEPVAFEPRSKRYHQMLDGYPEVTALAFSPKGSLLACGYDNGMLKLWEMSSEYADDHPSHGDSVIALAFSQDGENDGIGFIRWGDQAARYETSARHVPAQGKLGCSSLPGIFARRQVTGVGFVR